MRSETLEHVLGLIESAYPRMVVAASFARLGEVARAKALFADARETLDCTDRIHDVLVGAFGAFVAAPGRDFLVDPYRTQLNTLDRVASYKAAQLVAALTTDDAGIDPRAAYARGDSHHFQERPWKALPHVLRAAQAERLVETNPIECVEILRTLDETRALPIVVQLRNAPAVTIEIAGKFGWGELVPDALTALLTTNSTAIPATLPATLRALRRLGLREEVQRLIDAADVKTPKLRLLVAGARVWLGDSRGERVLDDAHNALAGVDEVAAMADVRAIAHGYALAPLRFALAGARRLATRLRDTRDDFDTSSHFQLSLVHLTASICLIVDEAFEEPA